jgi:hypothetical protein
LQHCGPFGFPVIERRGCGRVGLSSSGGFSGWASVFDEASGRMVGTSAGLDQQFGVCHIFGYTFGEEFNCANVESECVHCGLPVERPDLPPCADE